MGMVTWTWYRTIVDLCINMQSLTKSVATFIFGFHSHILIAYIERVKRIITPGSPSPTLPLKVSYDWESPGGCTQRCTLKWLECQGKLENVPSRTKPRDRQSLPRVPPSSLTTEEGEAPHGYHSMGFWSDTGAVGYPSSPASSWLLQMAGAPVCCVRMGTCGLATVTEGYNQSSHTACLPTEHHTHTHKKNYKHTHTHKQNHTCTYIDAHRHRYKHTGAHKHKHKQICTKTDYTNVYT